jgi:hypothetical protein
VAFECTHHLRHINIDDRQVKLAPAVGFEPTTNRLTADRSTTELRWIFLSRLRSVNLACAICGGKFESANPTRLKNWLRGRDLNPRSRGRGIMSRTATGQSVCKIHRLLFVVSARVQVSERLRDSSLRSAISISKVPSRESIWNHPHCADRFCDRHHRMCQRKIFHRDSG